MVSTRAAALHGVEVGDGLRIVLPRSTDELAEWGRALRNCVGSFGPAVAAGRSLLFGVEVHDVLAYCLEYAEGITFSKGIAEPDVPALTVRDLG